MSRVPIVIAALAASLMSSGCKNSPQTFSPASPPVTVAPSPTTTRSDAQLEADRKFLRDVEEKKRKSHSAYLNKTKAYQNYLP